MLFTETKLKGAFVIELEKKEDRRGFFARSFCSKAFEMQGLNPVVAQGNITCNVERGTLRGMHFQTSPYQEEKTVRCVAGSIFDVIVDLRPDSATYKQSFGVELSANNDKMLYIPKDFAHGYLTLADGVKLIYSMSQFHRPEFENGIRYDDPVFAIQWPQDQKVTVISERDQNWPDYEQETVVRA